MTDDPNLSGEQKMERGFASLVIAVALIAVAVAGLIAIGVYHVLRHAH